MKWLYLTAGNDITTTTIQVNDVLRQFVIKSNFDEFVTCGNILREMWHWHGRSMTGKCILIANLMMFRSMIQYILLHHRIHRDRTVNNSHASHGKRKLITWSFMVIDRMGENRRERERARAQLIYAQNFHNSWTSFQRMSYRLIQPLRCSIFQQKKKKRKFSTYNYVNTSKELVVSMSNKFS